MTHDDRQFIQQLFETQTQQFQRHLSAVSESFDHKIGPIVEGHESLRSEIRETRTELKHEIELCNFKIDAVAADLKAHRADTEAHQVYRVKEG